MGVALWLTSGVTAWIVARIIPYERKQKYGGEILIALVSAMAAGVTATALDFGGWSTLDWRAGAFAFAVALAALAAARLIRRG